MRKPIIAGNWKMNMTVSQTEEFINLLKEKEISGDVETIIAMPFTSLSKAKELLKDTNIKLASQNMYFEDKGAFTGEISPLMLKDLTSYVILGHSERREIFNESDELLNKKLKSALNNGLNPILCCGETLEERESNLQEKKVKSQLLKDLESLEENELKNLVIAYEPIWAIGTGKTASPEDAEQMCSFIRSTLKEMYSENLASSIRILYGGSVKSENIKDIMEKENIDGTLIGGASLKVDSFIQLINY
ncbi:triose-phosphate isomerase [Lagierella sp.]|uniref:triose-phosphate isomerase n=1 Tax=Lagierella sp. TaxID=2849657 RepID=UPI00262BF3BB|nr:triose-phosphate isomerase [Lagierella sp.]